MAEVSEELKERVKSERSIKSVHFNKAGEYIFHSHPSFDHETMTREEVLGEEPVKERKKSKKD